MDRPDLSPPSSSSTPAEPGCPFCERMATPARLVDRRVYEDEAFDVTHQVEDDDEPSYLGILLIQTRRHVPGLAELTAVEAEGLGRLLRRLSRALKACTPASWTYVFAFMEGVRHVHVLVAARYPDTPKEHVRLGITDWAGAPRADRAGVAELVGRLRAELARDD